MIAALLAGSSLASAAVAQTESQPSDAGEAAANPGAPIVSDRDFEAQLPPIDPALNGPLEPIESFDMPAAPAAEAGQSAPGETIADAPLPDAALTEPLPPIATFDVTTPPPTAGDAEPPPVRYTLAIEGLEAVGLEGRFRELSALEDADGEAANGAMIAARAREDETLAVRLLRSEGYYDAAALATTEQIPEQPGQLRVTLTAVPGQRYAFGAIDLPGAATVPPGLAREALTLEPGKPIVAAEVEGAEANVLLRLPEQGYPFASVGQRDILLDPATALGDYTLPVEPGIRARFGGYTTEGDLAFDAEHVGVLARFDRGEL
ncbi:MAG TPA: hypothetical protein VF589_05910, partial [Allosphingosinicella sp.]